MTPLAVLSAAHHPHERALHAYLNNLLPATEWRRTDQLARRVWEYALARADMSGPAWDGAAGLPVWLAATARTVVRRYLTAGAATVNWTALEQQLGRPDTWPPRWHQALATGGQGALLTQAAADLALFEGAVGEPVHAAAA
ncbi:hypothetical protein V1J52_25260 [Streptomyces sp. TRM 70351]|uniref:hypothetical protein n=1 Tax=Streptomyces sp. TRM 70351 TaxID=3116552 RepID=UPI002E7B329D|nr:hypothetical protein [Streptomyces sp. TRM 70351]MEE1931433.1 hypothetical protein [Streptomyces sp. TRM 70351]